MAQIAILQDQTVFDLPQETSASGTRGTSFRERVAAVYGHEKIRAVRDHKLTKIFAKVASGAAINYAFKTAAVGAATSAGANIIVAAGIGGATVTLVGAARDYREFLKAQEEAERKRGAWNVFKGFLGFVGDNRSTYAKKLAMNTGFAALGAAAVEHWQEIKDFCGPLFAKAKAFLAPAIQAAGPALKTMASGLKSFASGFGRVMSALSPVSAAHAAEYVPGAASAAAQGVSLNTINTQGWNAKALADLAAAQKGAPWAVQNLAHYAAHGQNGVKVDFALAKSLAEQAQAHGNERSVERSIRFLEDLKKVWPQGFEAASGSADAAPSNDLAAGDAPRLPVVEQQNVKPELSSAAAPLTVDLDGLNTQGWNARALSDLRAAKAGAPWAIQNLAHYAANGLNGVKVDLAQAQALAQNAAAHEHERSGRFLTELKKIWPGAAATQAPGAINSVAEELAAQAPAAPSAPPLADSNVCHVLQDQDMRRSGIVDLRCDNDNTRIASGGQIEVIGRDGERINVTNSYNYSVRVGALKEAIARSMLFRYASKDHDAGSVLAAAGP